MTDTQARPSLSQALDKLVALGLRVAEATTEIIEAEKCTVAAATSWLPAHGVVANSMEEARAIGGGIDMAEDALAHAAPRVATLSLSFERVSRAVRRAVALARRLEQGWPLSRSLSDNRRTMLLRQVARGVGDVIKARTQGDADTERLFADLAAKLEDPDFEPHLLERPVGELVQMLCRAIGLPPEPDGPAQTCANPGKAARPARRNDPG